MANYKPYGHTSLTLGGLTFPVIGKLEIKLMHIAAAKTASMYANTGTFTAVAVPTGKTWKLIGLTLTSASTTAVGIAVWKGGTIDSVSGGTQLFSLTAASINGIATFPLEATLVADEYLTIVTQTSHAFAIAYVIVDDV